MNQNDINTLGTRRKAEIQLPECPKCGERYLGDGVELCIECASLEPKEQLQRLARMVEKVEI